MWHVFHYFDDGSGLQQIVQRQSTKPQFAPAQTSFNLVAVQRRQFDGKVEVRYSTNEDESASFAIESK